MVSLDDILMALGALSAERRHREEGKQEVTVMISSDYKLNQSFYMVWNTGNKLDIFLKDTSPYPKLLATINVGSYGAIGRGLAQAIYGIIWGAYFVSNQAEED